MLTAFCVVWAGFSAATSAINVVDHIQHDGHILHAHDGHLTLVADGRHADVEYEDQRAADPGAGVDHPAGLGHHHHADAPIGAFGSAPLMEHAYFGLDPNRPPLDVLDVRGVRPGGLERPPKIFARPV